jgi:hypothetical protein
MEGVLACHASYISKRVATTSNMIAASSYYENAPCSMVSHVGEKRSQTVRGGCVEESDFRVMRISHFLIAPSDYL